MTLEKPLNDNVSRKELEINQLEIKEQEVNRFEAEENVVYLHNLSFDVINKIGRYTFLVSANFRGSYKGKYVFELSYSTLELGFSLLGLTKENKSVLAQNFRNFFYTIKKHMKNLPIVIECNALGNVETEKDKEDIISEILSSPSNYHYKESLVVEKFSVLREIYEGIFGKKYRTKFADKVNLIARLRSKIQEDIFKSGFPKGVINRKNKVRFTIEI